MHWIRWNLFPAFVFRSTDCCWPHRTWKKPIMNHITVLLGRTNARTIPIRHRARRNCCPRANASITSCIVAVRIPKQKWWNIRCRCPNSYQITRSAIRIMRGFILNYLSPIASKPMQPMPRARNQRNMTLTTRRRCAKGSMHAKTFWNVCDLINAFISSWRLPCSTFCCIRSTFIRRTDGECCLWLWRWCSVALPCSLYSWLPCGIPWNGMASFRANWQWKSHWKWVTLNDIITGNHAFNQELSPVAAIAALSTLVSEGHFSSKQRIPLQF